MVAEIVDHRHPAGFTPHLHPALDAEEGIEGRLDDRITDPAVTGRGGDRQRVAHVELAHHGDPEPGASQFELGAVILEHQTGGLQFVLGAEPEALDRAVAHVEQRSQMGLVAVGQQQSVPRDQVDEPAEAELDVGQRRKDVGVIELEVVQNSHLGQVVDELGTLVEEGRVVFVTLDHEPFGVGEAGPLPQIAGDAADEERRIQARALEHPGQERGGGGLAVGAGHHQRTPPPDEELLEQFGQRAVAQLAFQHRLGLGIASGDGIADDHQVGLVGQVDLGIAGHHPDAPFGQEGGHRRIDHVLVGTGDLVAEFVHGDRRAGHGGAPDPDEMNASKIPEHGSMLGTGSPKPKPQTLKPSNPPRRAGGVAYRRRQE